MASANDRSSASRRIDPFTQRRLSQRREPVTVTQMGLLDYGECAHCRDYKAEIERLQTEIAGLHAAADATALRQRETQEQLRTRMLRRWRHHHFVERPGFYNQMVAILEAAKAEGYSHYGIGRVMEDLRYDARLSDNAEAIKLVEGLGTIYARMVEELRPDLADLLDNRESKLFDGYRPWAKPWTNDDEARDTRATRRAR